MGVVSLVVGVAFLLVGVASPLCFSLALLFSQFTSSRIMTLAKETEKEKDAPKAREAVYLLLDLVRARDRPHQQKKIGIRLREV